jgi:hypothetical protein
VRIDSASISWTPKVGNLVVESMIPTCVFFQLQATLISLILEAHSCPITTVLHYKERKLLVDLEW